MSAKRYRFILVDEPDSLLPVPYRASRRMTFVTRRVPDPLFTLLEAFEAIARRSSGPRSWARHISGNPVAFLLDSMSEAVVLRDDTGRALYRNPAAMKLSSLITPLVSDLPIPRLERIQTPFGLFERRTMAFEPTASRHGYTIEILRKMNNA